MRDTLGRGVAVLLDGRERRGELLDLAATDQRGAVSAGAPLEVDADRLELGLALDELVDGDGALLLLGRCADGVEIGLERGEAPATSASKAVPDALGQMLLLDAELVGALDLGLQLGVALLLEALELGDTPAGSIGQSEAPTHSFDDVLASSESAVSFSSRDSADLRLAPSFSICLSLLTSSSLVLERRLRRQGSQRK